MLLFLKSRCQKDHLVQGNLLKTTLLNEKQANLEKEMYGNISLCSQYFSPGVGINVHKTCFYFLKLMKKYFIISYIKKAQYKIKKYVHVTHTTDWNISFKDQDLKDQSFFTLPKTRH